MFSAKAFTAVLLAAAVLGANAQSSTGAAPTAIPSGITTCALGCISQSLPAGNCSAITDLNCICTSLPFQQAAAQCISTTCPSSDTAAALAAQAQECAAVVSESGSATSAPSATSSGSTTPASSPSASSHSGSSASTPSGASTASPSPTSPTTPSPTGNGAIALSSSGSLVGFAVAIVGAVAGVFVL
ncbi:hypothetical protein EUX98_g4509 [Antrodiella citrinella]|uniref:CFEM domain-containing protein n=1 Tax=Antrodiella citrinella TaxID=2447956 RepID=A0A4S4MTU2_9APHY|nr:hypothetical protein EUX98_g4509 [Antrodiella citrinella]